MGVTPVQDTTVVVIGAGITGIGAAYYLRANGFPYVVLEANDDLGGTWYTQRWHGARCDSDFVKYSYSFKPHSSRQCLLDREDIHRYLRSVAEEFSILEHIRFETRVISASFDTDTQCWVVHTDRGSFRSQFLINGNGYFSLPYVPTFSGTDSFVGEIVHTFDLDAARRFPGQHVVLVGSGSTAICAAPELARVSRSMTMLQRSPSYIYEIDNRATVFMRLCQSLHTRGFAFPMRVLRAYLQARDDAIFVGFRTFPRIARWYFRKHWTGTVSPAELKEHFSPSYSPWEQRIPVAIGFKDAVRRGAVRVKTATIERFSVRSIVLAGGEELACDVCILATGFQLDFVQFELLVDGVSVDTAGINFYKGIMMGGVPNYFQPVGVWHSAWTQRSEASTRFAMKIMNHMASHGLRQVSIERKAVRYTPAITPNYLMRDLPELPRLYGSWELPSVDNLFRYRFEPRKLNFA
ncbi:flavin-containing monooxygenase [Mycobacterium asiaticum]|nr:NAD(P)/FAD-dependent oxidoreductase [Mycobacterium asiaticum]